MIKCSLFLKTYFKSRCFEAIYFRKSTSLGTVPNALSALIVFTKTFKYWSSSYSDDLRVCYCIYDDPEGGCSQSALMTPGLRFTNAFSIAIQIRSKIRFALTSIRI